MFLGIGQFGNLINPAAVQLLKKNAYDAAKLVLGSRADQGVLMKAAELYATYVIPRTNRALTTQEIFHDFNFSKFVTQAQNSDKPKVSHKDEIVDVSDYSLSGSMFGGIPNYLIYGAVAFGGYYYWKKRKGKGAPPVSAASAVPTGVTA